jgi:hypothetical protein
MSRHVKRYAEEPIPNHVSSMPRPKKGARRATRAVGRCRADTPMGMAGDTQEAHAMTKARNPPTVAGLLIEWLPAAQKWAICIFRRETAVRHAGKLGYVPFTDVG